MRYSAITEINISVILRLIVTDKHLSNTETDSNTNSSDEFTM